MEDVHPRAPVVTAIRFSRIETYPGKRQVVFVCLGCGRAMEEHVLRDNFRTPRDFPHLILGHVLYNARDNMLIRTIIFSLEWQLVALGITFFFFWGVGQDPLKAIIATLGLRLVLFIGQVLWFYKKGISSTPKTPELR